MTRAGRIATVAVDPTDNNHWLAGAGNGGIWETRDGGSNWVPLTDDAPTLAIGAIAFAPSDPKIIYAATGEAVAVGFARTGLGMLKSTDGGRSWTLLAASDFARASVRRVRVHPTNPNIVLAISQRGGFGRDAQLGAPSPPPFGFLKSGDGGVTWTRTLAGQATALEVDPTNFQNLYAAIGDQRIGLLNDSPNSAPNGLYRSVDGGTTWASIDGPWGRSTSTAPAVGRVELSIAPSNPNVLYASIGMPPVNGGPPGNLLGLWRTDNAWAAVPSWVRIATEPSPGRGGYCDASAVLEGAKCDYVHVISVDPADPGRLFAGAFTLWRCSPCDETGPVWTDVNRGIQSDQHAMAWAGARLILGNDHGVYSTANLGIDWQNHNRTLLNIMFYSGALHPTNADFMLGGLRDFLPAFRANSDRWDELPNFQAGGHWGEAEVVMSSTRPDTDWMLATNNGFVNRTTDGGNSGIRADGGIDKKGAAFVAPVRKCPGNDDVFVTGTLQMWRTDNFFSSTVPTWVANGPSGSDGPNGLMPVGTILSIGFAPTDRTCNTYVYGNRGGQIHLTADGGRSWKDLDSNRVLPARPVNSVVFHPTNPNVIYAALSSFNTATPAKPGHVFKTMNALAASPTWINISPPDDLPYNVIAIDPSDPNIIFAGTDAGLWFSKNGGSGWQRFGPNNGLPNASIFDLQINPATGRTVAFTYGRGAFALDVAAVPPSGPMLAIPPISSLLNAATGQTYSLALTTIGGTPPYRWVLASGTLPTGLMLSSSGVISGIPTASGVFTFSVIVTDGASGIATQTYTLTVASAPTLTRVGGLAQLASGNGWLTQIVLTNTSSSAVTASTIFHADDGSLLNVPITAVLQGVTQTATSATFTGTINPNATLVITMEDQLPMILDGWGDILASGPLGGFAIFRYTDLSGRVSEGTSPLQTQFPAKFAAPFDNTNGFGTGLAIANPSASTVTVTATISDQDGGSLGVETFTLAGSSHMAFFFPEKFPATTGKQGIVTFQATGTPGLAALELRFSPFGTFTSVPTVPAQ